jgi:4-hydroxybenzoate polyprenyltransferase
MTAAHFLRAMRPQQWVKNLFVLGPLVFAERAFDPEPAGRATLGCWLFCVLSGCIYVLNDIIDAPQDRQHPVKRHRPIAAGHLSPRAAGLSCLVLAALSFAAAGTWLPSAFAWVAAGYLGLQVAYSLRLKHVVFVDVGCIATGFILRLLAGAVAIDVPLSAWLLVCTGLLAAFLGLGKRRHELAAAGENAVQQRLVLKHYPARTLRVSMATCGAATAVAYGAYLAFGRPLGAEFSPRDLVWTMPMVLFGLWRFLVLTDQLEGGKSPTDRMLRDPWFVLNLVLWAAMVLMVVYWQ